MSHQAIVHRAYDGAYSSIVAGISFGLGTLLFLLYKFTQDQDLILTGLFYVGIASVINGLVLLHLLTLLRFPELREATVVRILILLANLPVAYFYLNNL